MSIEERLKNSLADQVDSTPAVLGLADRSLRRARQVRRTQAAVSVTAVALIAIAVPLRLAASRDGDQGVAVTPSGNTATTSTAPSTSSSTSAASTVAPPEATAAVTPGLHVGPEPRIDHATDNNLHRPIGREPRFVSLPNNAGAVYQTPAGTVVLEKRANAALTTVFIVRPDGSVRELAANPGLSVGIAVDASRLAYRSEYDKEGVGVALVLLDLRSGKVLQRLEHHGIASTPVAFGGDHVLLANGDGNAPEKTVGSWDLKTNSYRDWDASAGDILDVANGIALIAEGDRSCVAVVDIASLHQRFSSCVAGRASSFVDRFGSLSPDGKRYAGGRYSQDELVSGTAKPPVGKEWPIIGDSATGAIDDGLRQVFRNVGLRLDPDAELPVVWEDSTHILAVALGDHEEHLVVRCDVDATTCESAVNYGAIEVPLKITLARRIS